MSEETVTETENEIDYSELQEISDLCGYDPEEQFPYVPKGFREKFPEKKHLWPVFYFKTPTAQEGARITDSAGHVRVPAKNDGNEDMIFEPEQGKAVNKILNKSLVGCKNYRNKDGDLIDFIKQPNNPFAAHKFLDQIPTKLRTELANASMEHITLSKEDLQGLEY